MCQNLKSMNMSSRQSLTISMTADRCIQSVARMYAPLIVTAFNDIVDFDPTPIETLFSTLQSEMLLKLSNSWPTRFRAKIHNLHLDVGPHSFPFSRVQFDTVIS